MTSRPARRASSTQVAKRLVLAEMTSPLRRAAEVTNQDIRKMIFGVKITVEADSVRDQSYQDFAAGPRPSVSSGSRPKTSSIPLRA